MEECLNVDEESEIQTTHDDIDIDIEAGKTATTNNNNNNKMNININTLSEELIAAYDDGYRIKVCHKFQSLLILITMLSFITYKLWFIFYSETNIVTEYKYISSDTTLMPAIFIQVPSGAFIENISIVINSEDMDEAIIISDATQTIVKFNDSLHVNEEEIDVNEWNIISWDYASNDEMNAFETIDTVSVIPPKNYGVPSNGWVNLNINHGISFELMKVLYDLDLKSDDFANKLKNDSWKILAEQYFGYESLFGITWIPLDSTYFFKIDESKKAPISSFVFASTHNTIYYDLIEQIDETAIMSKNEEEPLRIFTATNPSSTELGIISLNDECKININDSISSECLMYFTTLSIGPNPTSQGMNARIVIKHKIEMKELPEIIGGFFHILERCLEVYLFIPLLFGTICGISIFKICGFKGYAPNHSLSVHEKHKILLFLQELQIIDTQTSQINKEEIKSIYKKKPKGICCTI